MLNSQTNRGDIKVTTRKGEGVHGDRVVVLSTDRQVAPNSITTMRQPN